MSCILKLSITFGARCRSYSCIGVVAFCRGERQWHCQWCDSSTRLVHRIMPPAGIIIHNWEGHKSLICMPPGARQNWHMCAHCALQCQCQCQCHCQWAWHVRSRTSILSPGHGHGPSSSCSQVYCRLRTCKVALKPRHLAVAVKSVELWIIICVHDRTRLDYIVLEYTRVVSFT